MSDKIFTFRIAEELLDLIRQSAERNKRSIAKEIEYVLEQYYTTNNSKFLEATPKITGLVTSLLQELGYDISNLEINGVSKPYTSKTLD